MEKKLEVKNLKISFRTQSGILKAVRDISFNLYKGETLAIVGESGSGKSVTNRAVMGILAGNGFIESGEIIYDGQDLVQITEEDFHKLRGDKIAMIFQDPLSSLNPIMKIGKQLTEAMLLKNSASRRNARTLFNSKLSILNKAMDDLAEGDASAIALNKEACKTFDSFCIKSTELEGKFNDCYIACEEAKLDAEDLAFLIEKKQKVDFKASVKELVKDINKAVHPRVVVMNEEMVNALNNIKADAASSKKNEIPENAVKHLNDLAKLLGDVIALEKPNFFCYGYYALKNPNASVDDLSTEELNKMVRKYLDDEFMLKFIHDGSKAILYSRQQAVERSMSAMPEFKAALDYFKAGHLDQKTAVDIAKKIGALATDAIDTLEVHKSSTEYTFEESIIRNTNKYFAGIKNNVKEQKRFDKQTAKYNALVKKGRNPDWKVAPLSLFSEEDGINTICHLIQNLIDHYQRRAERTKEYDSEARMVGLIDYFKEQASALVTKVTKKTAKATALKLLEEVGIPEPAIRYNQYPFEFSGGMRQRIVIAIALAANPDILICDEPTTALDVTIQAQILELINKLKRERNLSVIFITHNLGVVANMADRIAVMYAGKIVEVGTSDDIFYDPRHPYTWALLSSMPDLDTKDKLETIPGTPPNMIYPPKGDAFAARNKYALEIDFEEQPPMFDISETHKAATWLLHPNAPKINPPKIVTDRIERMKIKEAK